MTTKTFSTLRARAALLGLTVTESKSGFALRDQTHRSLLKTRALSRIGAELTRRETARLELERAQ